MTAYLEKARREFVKLTTAKLRKECNMDDNEKGAFYRDCLERRIGWLKDSIAKINDDAGTVVFHARRAAWYSEEQDQVAALVKAADDALADARVQLRDVMDTLMAPVAEAAE